MVRLIQQQIPEPIDESYEFRGGLVRGKASSTHRKLGKPHQVYEIAGHLLKLNCRLIVGNFRYGVWNIVLHCEDSPFEDVITVSLIKFGQIIDEVSTLWGAGWIEDLEIVSDNILQFQFIGREYRCEILDKPTFFIKPIDFFKNAAWYRSHFRSHFKLTSQKTPPREGDKLG